MGATVRYGVIGCGLIAQLAHLPALQSIPESEIVVVSSRRKHVAEAMGKLYGTEWVTEATEVFERKDVDAVAILTSHESHAPLMIQAAKAGKHVIVEKPIAPNVKDAKDMVNAAKKAGVKLMVAYQKRYDVNNIKALTILNKGMIGEPTFARCHQFRGEWIANRDTDVQFIVNVTPYYEEEGDRYEWFKDTWVGEESHLTNLMRFLLGDPTEVRCETWKDDLKFSLATFSWGNRLKATLERGFMPSKFWNEECQIYGTSGFLDLKQPIVLLWNTPAKLKVYTDNTEEHGANWHTFTGEWQSPFRNEHLHFIECVNRDKEPRSSGKDSIKDVRIAESVRDSLKTGKTIKL